jgi:hypothetical protein
VEFPEVGLDTEEAAQEPFGPDEGIHLETLVGREGLEARGIFVLEGAEIVPILAKDELGFGVEPGLEGVLGGDGLAFRGAGAGGFLRVEAVGLNLTLRRHKWWVPCDFKVAGEAGDSGGGGLDLVDKKGARILRMV